MTQLAIIAGYLVLLLVLGVCASRWFRGTSQDYMLASHSIGPFLLLMSLFGTTMTAFALVGSSGEAYKEGIGVYGMLASSSGIIHSLCFFVVGVKLWDFGHRFGYTTQIEFFRDRLECNSVGIVLFPVLVGLVVPYLLIGVLAAGTVINSISVGAFSESFAAYDYGLPNWLGSLVVCSVVLCYVFFGGMRGTAWANAFQTLIFMALGLVTFSVIAGKLGGLEAASQAVLEKHPSKLMRDVAAGERADYARALHDWKLLAEYAWAVEQKGLALAVGQKQQAEQRFRARMPGWRDRAAAQFAARQGLLRLSNKDKQRAYLALDDRVAGPDEPLLLANGNPRPLAQFPRSSTWPAKALALYADKIGHPRAPLDPDNPAAGNKWPRRKALGVYRATHWAPEMPRPLSKLKFFTYLLVPFSVGMFPHLFQHWLTARSAAAFKLPVVAHPIFIMIVWVPCVLVGVWATSATVAGRAVIAPHFPPNAVLVKMVADLTGPVLGGLLTAGILAAIMSSLDSQFLCLGTMFTNDVVLHYWRGQPISDGTKVLLARAFIVAIVALTYGLSLLEPRRVFTLGVWCFSGFASLFPLVFAAVRWRRLSASGALLSVLAAITSWTYFFWQSDFGARADYAIELSVAGQTYQMMPVAPIFACATVVLVAVSLLTRPPSDETIAKFFG
ncbi:MAG: hypothetical protein BMS9Abin04_313 [Planctomycetia bacterium]|nr:MAG: hypothetical protein BMS9Abin04_313 [Planctomycetia bacterium]